MRILRIHIKNINSLKGEFNIDFASGALHHAGIFAITGATGAGKTTVLDAITLALYGKVARNKNEKEVMSHGTTECHAEVEFQVFDNKYLASWQIHRARKKIDGKISGSKRELAQWNEASGAYEVIAEKIKDVDIAVEKVSGLDYHRFTRSVLLSQGDFAAFLRADERERSDLLERITGTEIYSELSIAAFNKHKIEKQLLENLQTKLEQLGLFSDELMDEKDLAIAKKETKNREKEVATIREKLQVFDRWKEAMEKATGLKEELATATNLIETFLPKALLISRSKALRPHHITIEKLEQINNQILVLNNLTEALQGQVSKSTNDEKQFKITLEEFIQKNTLFQKGKTVQEAVFYQIETINEQLGLARKAQVKNHDQLALQSENLISKEQNKTQLSQRIDQLENSLKDARLWIVNNEQLADLPTTLPAIEELRTQLLGIYQRKGELAEKYLLLKKELDAKQEKANVVEANLQKNQAFLNKLEAAYQQLLPNEFTETKGLPVGRLGIAIQELQEKVQKIRQLSILEDDYKLLLKEHENYENRLNDLSTKQQNTSKELLSLLDQKIHFEKELSYKKAIYKQQQLIVNYTKDRKDLQQGDVCPLCLSTDHPFHEHPVEAFVDKAQDEWEQAEAYYLQLQQRGRIVGQKENELNKEIELLQGDELKNVGGRLAQQKDKLKTYENRIAELLKGAVDTEGDFLKLKLQELEKQLIDWQNIQSKVEDLRQQMIVPKEAIQKQDRDLLSLHKEIEAHESQLKMLADTLEEQEERFAQLVKQLSAKTKKYGYTFELETAKVAFQTLRSQGAEYQHKQMFVQKNEQQLSEDKLRLDHIEKEIKQLSEELTNTRTAGAETQHRIQEFVQKKEALLGNKTVEQARSELEETDKRLATRLEESRENYQETAKQLVALVQQQKEKTEQLDQLEKEARILKNSLLKALAKLGYSSVAVALKDYLPLKEEKVLEETLLENNNRLLAIERAIKEVDKELKKWTPSDKEKDKETALRTSFTTLTVAYEESLYKYGQLDQKFKQQQEREKQHGQLLAQIELQRMTFNRWAQLNELIGQADGKKFRTYAQGLTLQKLVAIANQYLEKLNGRYYIHKKDDADLELEIIDTYQADNRRSMYTLSGGESFLISLALAMGLSELAGKNAQIHSLFIDEGFGTLDAQSLDLALTTLENLQSEGKTIGVISHLKELKERIGVQIQLHKQSNGFSALSVVG